MFTSYAWAFKETWRGLCRDGRMLFLATALAGFALSVPLFIFTVVYGISEPIRSLPTAVEISVFTTEKADVKALTEEIEALPDIESVRHIPKETAFRELNEGLGVKRSKMHNPLPDLLVATVSDRADPDEIEKTASAMEKLEGVDMIAYESEWHTKLTVLTDVVRTGLLFLGGTIFLLVSLVLWAALRMTTLSARAKCGRSISSAPRRSSRSDPGPGGARSSCWRGRSLQFSSRLRAFIFSQVRSPRPR